MKSFLVLTVLLSCANLLIGFTTPRFPGPLSQEPPRMKGPPICPIVSEMHWTPTSIKCHWDDECPMPKRCCPYASKTGLCVDQATTNPTGSPKVTPIISGSFVNTNGVFTFVSSVTLIQSKGKNYLFDVGTTGMVDTLLNNLYSIAGLRPYEIDAVIVSHGHPDHVAAMSSFDSGPMYFNTVIVDGVKYTFTPLGSGPRLFVNNDTNLEIVLSPGHTEQDISLIVTNAEKYGTVALVGDLITYKDDGGDAFAQNKAESETNRKKIACAAKYIVPGHGAMFEMDADQKTKFKC